MSSKVSEIMLYESLERWHSRVEEKNPVLMVDKWVKGVDWEVDLILGEGA